MRPLSVIYVFVFVGYKGIKVRATSSRDCSIIVLKVSNKKFDELIDIHKNSGGEVSIQTDLGLTEVEAGTETAAAWIENK